MDHSFIKLGESNGKGQYAWRQQIPQPGGTWSDGPAVGTFDSWPACELNGNADIKAGTIVVASLSPDTETLRFQWE
jgi:hypothetical protein